MVFLLPGYMVENRIKKLLQPHPKRFFLFRNLFLFTNTVCWNYFLILVKDEVYEYTLPLLLELPMRIVLHFEGSSAPAG